MTWIKRHSSYTEEELILGCRKNDRDIQEALYLKYFDTMLRMCMRYTSREDAAVDIVNNGFLKVFKKIDSYESRGSLEGWIRRCVYHCLCDFFRKEKREIRFLEMKDHAHPSVSNSGLPSLYMEDLLEIIEDLPDISKRVFTLFAIEGYSHKEIGVKLEMSEGTSKWHVSNARKLLKEKVSKYKLRRQSL